MSTLGSWACAVLRRRYPSIKWAASMPVWKVNRRLRELRAGIYVKSYRRVVTIWEDEGWA